jgi:hypothetical protein
LLSKSDYRRLLLSSWYARLFDGKSPKNIHVIEHCSSTKDIEPFLTAVAKEFSNDEHRIDPIAQKLKD